MNTALFHSSQTKRLYHDRELEALFNEQESVLNQAATPTPLLSRGRVTTQLEWLQDARAEVALLHF